MGFLSKLLGSYGNQTNRSSQVQNGKNVVIKCASCGGSDLYREGREYICCRSCGAQYTMDEARKKMGTSFCRDCIYHSINLYAGGITEHCVIWGLDKCRSRCDRKETKPPHRWTDANRWDKD